tara:strand:- start:26848 stop:27339 length:492 start_codon:yes stop_codon:yes gene_type:complete
LKYFTDEIYAAWVVVLIEKAKNPLILSILRVVKINQMKFLKPLLSATVSLIVLNVWLFRFNKPTMYRGGDASNMIDEFAVYGLDENFVYIIGALKVLAAIGLLVGLIKHKLIIPAAVLMAVLMLGAIGMHFKVNDQAIKFLPSSLMLLFSLGIFFLQKTERNN